VEKKPIIFLRLVGRRAFKAGGQEGKRKVISDK
jgi:hypothetical protein